MCHLHTNKQGRGGLFLGVKNCLFSLSFFFFLCCVFSTEVSNIESHSLQLKCGGWWCEEVFRHSIFDWRRFLNQFGAALACDIINKLFAWRDQGMRVWIISLAEQQQQHQ